MKSCRFALPIVFSLLVIAVVACANDTPAASPDDTVSSDDSTPTAGPVDAPPTGDLEMIEEPAPIESVVISIGESFPPQYFVKIVSGLQNGCAQYNGYEMDGTNEMITIDVTNRVPKPDQLISCTEIYGFHEENINLGSEFEGGKTYTVVVNDVTETFVAQGGEEPPLAVTEPAPIKDVRINVNASGTDHLVVTSGLPNSCHEFAEYLAQRTDDEIVIELLNYRYDMQLVEVVDADGAKYMRPEPIVDRACAEIYRTIETEIEIGDDIEPCKGYTVDVNGEKHDVQAIAPNVRCANPNDSTQQQSGDDAKVETALAPIVNGEVISTKSIPPEHTLVVTSGLPNGCTEFGGYEVVQDGNEIQVAVTNTVKTAGNICTQQYRSVETSIPLGIDFEQGSYVVVVNGKTVDRFLHTTGDSNLQPTVSERAVSAPIEAVKVVSTRSIPPQHTLIVKSGLPNGCAKFGDYEVVQDGNTISVRLTNLVPGSNDVVCTDNYRVVETRIPLGSEFESRRYTVDVNGTTTTFSHIGLPKLPAGTTTVVLAPIEGVSIEAAGAAPTQYVAHIRSALPNGCHRFDKYEVSREGTVVTIRVTNTLPANPRIMCTMVYGLVNTAVPLGSDFESGTTYTVDVNGETTTFVAGGG